MTCGTGAWRVTVRTATACVVIAVASFSAVAQSTRPTSPQLGSDGRQTVEATPNHALASVTANGTDVNGSLSNAEPSIARGPNESEPILRRGNSASSTSQPARSVSVPGAGGGLDAGKVMGSLGVVLALIFILRWSAKRVFPGQAGVRSSRAVQVVSRSVLSPKQQFLLLQVGKRLIVVADTGANMNALCQITDADEVAELLGQIRNDATESIGKNFMSLFGRNREKFDEPSTNNPGERAALLGADAPPDDDEDVAVGMTRDEISGLMDKVRMLSRQFKRP